MNYLIDRNWVCIRAGASKGMLDIDVLGYHSETGEIKHIQCKSNHGYTKSDLETLHVVKRIVKAPNVSVELWDWYDGQHYPVITVILSDKLTNTFCEDPKMKGLLQ